jgi:hypothetical protein
VLEFLFGSFDCRGAFTFRHRRVDEPTRRGETTGVIV